MSRRFISRQKVGKGFTYYLAGQKITDQSQLSRIKSLAIPPAWSDVRIALSARAKVQASGRDKAGRKQIIYSASFRAAQDKAKYERMRTFAKRLPKLRRRVERDLRRRRLSKSKVIAAIIKLIDQTYFRIGNQTYAKENKTYGVTTLRSQHADVHGDKITFDFIGKSHQHHKRTIKDGQLARIISRLDDLPGAELFQYVDKDDIVHPISSQDVNDYIKRHIGDQFSAKDFRTWGGTLQAVSELTLEEWPRDKKLRQKTVTACVRRVAKKLGNTPSVTRSSYIDPGILNLYDKGDHLHKTIQSIKAMRPQKYLQPEERCLQTVLEDL